MLLDLKQQIIQIISVQYQDQEYIILQLDNQLIKLNIKTQQQTILPIQIQQEQLLLNSNDKYLFITQLPSNNFIIFDLQENKIIYYNEFINTIRCVSLSKSLQKLLIFQEHGLVSIVDFPFEEELKFRQISVQLNADFVISYDNYVLTSQNQLLKLNWNKNSLQVQDSKQNVCKGIPLYIKQKQDELILITQSNEVIKINTKNLNDKKQEIRNQITQVKSDLYNTFYKTDSHPQGFDVSEQIISIITYEYIYWI